MIPNRGDFLDQIMRENKDRETARKKLERVKGIEPSYSAWKAAALPLSYTREAVVSTASGPAHAWRSAWRRTSKASPRSVKAAWRPFPAIAWFQPPLQGRAAHRACAVSTYSNSNLYKFRVPTM